MIDIRFTICQTHIDWCGIKQYKPLYDPVDVEGLKEWLANFTGDNEWQEIVMLPNDHSVRSMYRWTSSGWKPSTDVRIQVPTVENLYGEQK